ncbi:MAG: plasmid pRiA4b ORF-3 family protein [Ardenticatenaceae bacterium]|nr:plasmid pRiA4b ORF-3 family protein [Ardenticatenaceae bacterium]
MSEADTIFQFKVTLKEIKPPIWRRFQVRSDITFRDLHNTLQVVMGWWDSHPHLFQFGELLLTDAETLAEWGEGGLRDDTIPLNRLLTVEGTSLTYEYDFGDSWQHELVLEAMLPEEETAVYPRCLAGARACPPEDCGGIWGYEQFLEAIRDPNHEEHRRYREWIGGAFDPEAFDLDKVMQQFREGVYWQGELVVPPLTSTQTFTPQARWFWRSIPEEAQTRIIGTVWCSHCEQKTTITNFKGNIQQGDLILRGECVRCGGVVVRLLEGG